MTARIMTATTTMNDVQAARRPIQDATTAKVVISSFFRFPFLAPKIRDKEIIAKDKSHSTRKGDDPPKDPPDAKKQW